MSNLLASLSTSGNALEVFQQALTVIQNNVNNSSTAGYAAQKLNLEALPLVVAGGLVGGVMSSGLESSRDVYAEEQVQRQTQLLGQYTAQSQATDTLQNLFDVSGTSGLPAALNDLLSSFSAWSESPTDTTERQSVLTSAGEVAGAVNSLANSLSSASSQLNTEIGSAVDQINSLAGQVQKYNQTVMQQGQADPAADAQLHSALDSLSQLVNFTTVTQSDGTVAVMLSGGSPLVMGETEYKISVSDSVDSGAANPLSPPTAHILDSQGKDITSQVDSGQLGGLLDVRNRVLGGLLGDSQQAGSLNQFAKTLADSVNQILESGTVSTDTGAASGTALFTYDATDATRAAASLEVNPNITADQLAPVDSSGNANGNAIKLAGLGNSGTSATIGGMTLVQYLSQMASSIGEEYNTANSNETAQQQVVAQVTSLRSQISGVSLDTEAVNVLQFQRAYQAAAQVLTVLNTLADSVLSLVPPQ